MTIVNREAAIQFLANGALVVSRCDPKIRDNIDKARRDGLKAQTFDGEGSPTSSDPKLPVELGPDGNLLRDLTGPARKELDAGLEQMVAGMVRYLAAARPYVDLEAVHEDGVCPDGWCVSHYRLDHMHEPVAVGRYTNHCRFCGDFRAAVSAIVKPKKLGHRAGEPPTELLEQRHRYGRITQADHDAAVQSIAAPLMPKRKKAS